ncbi:hypothetical protein [Vibrio mediterranei]|uniref:hypothetical protein n=1 Tax=Vibrio mediterranei TaxID=689 RepID=UPI00148E1EEE|nr:hypothetical protein [Vibrio mediterranei]NOH31384.1 hypothetical protein [Vibrio mediterranei]
MRIHLLRPTRADINAQFELMKPAFVGLDFPKQEFERVKTLVRGKRASFYHLKGQGVSLRFIGEVQNEEDYFVCALTGKGLLEGLPIFIDAVKSQGYAVIKGQAVRKGIVRIYQRYGFKVTEQHGDVFHLALDLRG